MADLLGAGEEEGRMTEWPPRRGSLVKRTQAHRVGIFPGLFPERFLGVPTLLSAVAAKTVRHSPETHQ